MKTISRKQVLSKDKIYRNMLKTEKHHDHVIIEDEAGVLRWKENEAVRKLLTRISLNDLCPLLNILGSGKNSEIYRRLYREMGYSLFGYWEIFYWEVNNPYAKTYFPNRYRTRQKK